MTSLLNLTSLLTSRLIRLSPWAKQNFPAPLKKNYFYPTGRKWDSAFSKIVMSISSFRWVERLNLMLLVFQGPALCFYNNEVFSEEDWRGIRMIYSSVKEEDPLKVGRFGLGFKSVFHITGKVDKDHHNGFSRYRPVTKYYDMFTVIETVTFRRLRAIPDKNQKILNGAGHSWSQIFMKLSEHVKVVTLSKYSTLFFSQHTWLPWQLDT